MSAPARADAARMARALGGGLLQRLVGSRRPMGIIERNLLVYRHMWLVLLSGAIEPLVYLFALGIGLGGLVGEVSGPDGTAVTYAAFIAPALLAIAAMNGTVYETYNFFFKMRYARLYDAALATPLEPRDVATGEVVWSLTRAALYATGFLAATAALGLVASPWALLAVPASVLIGLAFGGLTVAASSYMRSWQDFDLLQMAVIPMFLFSATFYPLDVYPPAVRTIAQLSPLYHGVAIIRPLMLAGPEWTMIGHAGVLVGLGVAGTAVATRRIGALLRP